MLRRIKPMRYVLEDGTCVIWTQGTKKYIPPLQEWIVIKSEEILNKSISEKDKIKIRNFVLKNGVDWQINLVGNNNKWGSSIRRVLRNGGINDSFTPTNDLKDYYIVLVELATGAIGGEVSFINKECGREIYKEKYASK